MKRVQLDFEEIKGWFESDKWDIGYITLDQLKICSLTPIKIKYQYSKGWDFANDIHFNWAGIRNGIVLIKKSSQAPLSNQLILSLL